MNFCTKPKIPIDKNRLYLELIKQNKETLLRNNFSHFFKDLLEFHFKKKMVCFNSPFISSLIVILSKNSQDIFSSLINTYFAFDLIKKKIIENLILIGKNFLNISHLNISTGENFKVLKRQSIFLLFKNLKFHSLFKFDGKTTWCRLIFNTIFLLLGKYILIEISFVFLNRDSFIYHWLHGLYTFIKDRRIFQKGENTGLMKFFRILSYIYNNKMFVKETKKTVKTWKPDLYESCNHQLIFWNNYINSSKNIKSKEIRVFFGAMILFSNFQINLTGTENIAKLSQKHLTPTYFLTLQFFEKKICFIEKKKNSLDSHLISFQNHLLNKLEIFEKRITGFYLKFFFHFNIIL